MGYNANTHTHVVQQVLYITHKSDLHARGCIPGLRPTTEETLTLEMNIRVPGSLRLTANTPSVSTPIQYTLFSSTVILLAGRPGQ